MKTKNTRVRLKDIKSGRIIYIASPVHGIEKYLVRSKPYIENLGVYSAVFVKAQRINSDGTLWKYYDENCPNAGKSLRDMGVIINDYNHKRTFFKLKQAQDYVKRMRNDPSVRKTYADRDELDAWDLDYAKEY